MLVISSKINTLLITYVQIAAGSVNFLMADCETFSHPLHHLGKTVRDCPLVAIDSFKHMYMFPNFDEIR